MYVREMMFSNDQASNPVARVLSPGFARSVPSLRDGSEPVKPKETDRLHGGNPALTPGAIVQIDAGIGLRVHFRM